VGNRFQGLSKEYAEKDQGGVTALSLADRFTKRIILSRWPSQLAASFFLISTNLPLDTKSVIPGALLVGNPVFIPTGHKFRLSRQAAQLSFN